MKKLLLLSIISCFIFLQSCSNKGETYEGEWVTHDYDYDFELTCDCTDEQKSQMKEIAAEGMDLKIEQLSKATSVNFNKDHTFSGTMLGESLSGTYEATDDELTLKPENYPEETMEISKDGENTHFTYAMSKEDLVGISDSAMHPELGEIKIMITGLSFDMVNANETP